MDLSLMIICLLFILCSRYRLLHDIFLTALGYNHVKIMLIKFPNFLFQIAIVISYFLIYYFDIVGFIPIQFNNKYNQDSR